jgi:hypothetical protein
MHLLTVEAMSWLRDHHGIITARRLEMCGVSRRCRLALIDSRVLEVLHPGVYRIASQPATLLSKCVAICAAHPQCFITGPTAGTIGGLRRMPADDRVHVCAPHGLGRMGGLVVLRQSRVVDATDVQLRADGIRIASPWRLAFDLAADLGPLDHQSVVEQILDRRLCQISTLVATARRLARPARPGSQRFVATLAARVPGGPLESHPELIVAAALVARGVPIAAQATWLSLPDGGSARLDVSVAEILWGVEVDVHPDHLLLEGTTKDKRRDRQTRQMGWQVERVTQLDLLDIDSLADELVVLYERRRTEIEALRRSVA